MEWIFIVIFIAAFFTYQALRLRCPLCAKYVIHPKDEKEEEKMKANYENYKKAGLSTERVKPGYTNASFLCKNCQHSFSRRESMIWTKASNKLGDEIAIKEYKKLISER